MGVSVDGLKLKQSGYTNVYLAGEREVCRLKECNLGMECNLRQQICRKDLNCGPWCPSWHGCGIVFTKSLFVSKVNLRLNIFYTVLRSVTSENWSSRSLNHVSTFGCAMCAIIDKAQNINDICCSIGNSWCDPMMVVLQEAGWRKFNLSPIHFVSLWFHSHGRSVHFPECRQVRHQWAYMYIHASISHLLFINSFSIEYSLFVGIFFRQSDYRCFYWLPRQLYPWTGQLGAGSHCFIQRWRY